MSDVAGMEVLLNWLLTFMIIIFMFFFIWSAYKKQSLKETWDEIASIFNEKVEEATELTKYK